MPIPAEEQVCILYAGVRGFLDKLQTSEISKFEEMYLSLIRSKAPHIFTTIRTEGLLSKKTDGELKALLEEFMPASGLKMKVWVKIAKQIGSAQFLRLRLYLNTSI